VCVSLQIGRMPDQLLHQLHLQPVG
jgi:hypothetical protein